MIEELIKKNSKIWKKLSIVNKDNNNYELVDENDNHYNFRIELYDIDNTDNIKYLYISDSLLDPHYYEYSRSYIFGGIDQPYGRVMNNRTIQDLIMVEYEDRIIYLKRFYG